MVSLTKSTPNHNTHSGLQQAGKADGGAGGASRPAPIAAAPASKDLAAASGGQGKEENMELQLQTAKKLRSVSASALIDLGLYMRSMRGLG